MATRQLESQEQATPIATSRRLRTASLILYAATLTAYIATIGLPKQTVAAVAWIWLAVVAWDIRRPWRGHLAFARDWWSPVALLIVYLYSRGLADELGVPVHVTEPIEVDRWLFGGTLPTAFLQAHLCGVPCERSMPPSWYDVLLTTVYYSHFFVALAVAGVLWVRERPAWVRFMRRYLSLTVVTLAVYVLYPMAPPWMAARDGYIADDLPRITGRGWFDLGSSGVHQRVAAAGNEVAAMPSLHAAIALLIAVCLITRLRSGWRWWLLLYPAAMGFMLVYYAEHYVVDILAGWAAVAVVMVGASWWERSRLRAVPAVAD
jgi:hypothetical protein